MKYLKLILLILMISLGGTVLHASEETTCDEQGNYRFENVELNEGVNNIEVISRSTDKPGVLTRGSVVVIKDTIAPTIEATASRQIFSPNGDGKYDEAAFALTASEKGRLHFILRSEEKTLVDQELETTGGEKVQLIWRGQSLSVVSRDSMKESLIPETIKDGLYSWTVFAVDEAGNISRSLTGKIMVDLAPPEVLGLAVSPNPFVPNAAGKKTNFWLKLSKAATVTINILRPDGGLYASQTKSSGDFAAYVAAKLTGDKPEPAVAEWAWDGEGAKGEKIGGDFRYYLTAEDPVGNTVSTESRVITVDREHFLVGYLMAEPGIFSPANHGTKISYYLGADNLRVELSILDGEKRLVKQIKNSVEDKGEKDTTWDGSYDGGYAGLKTNGKVYNGGYTILLRVADENGRSTEVRSIVDVDNDPPLLNLRPVKVNLQSKAATLSYSVSEPVSIEVESIQAELAETILTATVATGEGSVYFVLPEGANPTLFFRVKATDRALNETVATSETFCLVPETGLRVVGLAAEPNPFTPNGDSVKDLTRISYSLAGGAPEYKVSVTILNSVGVAVRRLIDNESQNLGQQQISWDGRIDTAPGEIVYADDGDYTCQILVEDRLGEKVAASLPIRLVITRPSLTFTVAPLYISPNGDNYQDTANITYSIDYPVHWVDGAAAIKFDVLSSTGDTVYTKSFGQTPGTYSFTWDGSRNVGTGTVDPGKYYIYAGATDSLGSYSPQMVNSIFVDYLSPDPTDFSVLPQYVAAGGRVTIGLKFEEQLVAFPDVAVQLPNGKVITPTLESAVAGSYAYSYLVDALDGEGLATVLAKATDLSGNITEKTKTFTIDNTFPVMSGLSVAPNPAKAGSVEVSFFANEPLAAATVRIKQNNGAWLDCPVNGEWTVPDGSYVAKYTVPADQSLNGTAEVLVSVNDRAGNQSVGWTDFVVDTIAPVFLAKSLTNELHQGKNFAKLGDTVEITVTASEPLKFTPVLQVNDGRFAEFQTTNASNEYVYKYLVDQNDENGLARLTISGYDLALNQGETVAVSDNQSFNIDLIRPETTINDVVVSQNPFSPNNDGYQDATSFLFNLSEDVYLTIKVYTYQQDNNYNAGNLVKTVCQNLLTADRSEIIVWDGSVDVTGGYGDANANGYVDKGGYAYIVEARDLAGNLAFKKGGTVWAQEMPLTLFSSSPSRKIFSSAGNSPNKQVAVDYWLTAEYTGEVRVPEKISIFNAGHSRPVGSIKVEIRDFTDHLVKTIVSSSGAETQKITASWDGTDLAGQPVAEGKYYFVASAADLTGIPAALDPAAVRQEVIVDNTAPQVDSLSLINQFISPNSAQPTAIRETSLSYALAENLAIVNVTVDVEKGGVLVRRLIEAESREVTTVLVAQPVVGWDGSLLGGINYVGTANGGGLYADGNYSVVVTAVDQAGNYTSRSAALTVDTVKPTGTLSIKRSTGVVSEYTNSQDVKLSLEIDDANPDQISLSNDGVHYSAWETSVLEKAWQVNAGDGLKTAWARYLDKAGNLSDTEIKDSITLDTQKPKIVLTNEPLPIMSQRSATIISASLSDYDPLTSVDSSIESWQLNVVTTAGVSAASYAGSGPEIVQSWNAGGVTDGSWDGDYYYYITANDGAGNSYDSRKAGIGAFTPAFGGGDNYLKVVVDRTCPTAVISAPLGGNWIKGAVNVTGTANDNNPGNYFVYYRLSGAANWLELSNTVYPTEAKINSDNSNVLEQLVSRTGVTYEVQSQVEPVIAEASVEATNPGAFPLLKDFTIDQAGTYKFQTFIIGGDSKDSGSFNLKNNDTNETLITSNQSGYEQEITLDPGNYKLEGSLIVIGVTTVKAGMKLTIVSSQAAQTQTQENEFIITDRQAVRLKASCSGFGGYTSEHWLNDLTRGQTVAHFVTTNQQESYYLLEPGTYRLKTYGNATGSGSRVETFTEVYSKYAELTETAYFQVQLKQDVAVTAMPGYFGSSWASSEHFLLDSQGNTLYHYSGQTNNQVTLNLVPGMYTLKTIGRASYCSNYSLTLAAAKKNNLVGDLADWNTIGLNDSYDLKLKVIDGVSNETNVEVSGVKVDNTAPNLSVDAPVQFNPYIDETITAKVTVAGETCGQFVQYAQVYTAGGTKIADLDKVVETSAPSGIDYNNVTVAPNASNELSIKWNGRNGSGDGDYVNQGSYKYVITIVDLAGNQTTIEKPFELVDDQLLSGSSTDCHDPWLGMSGNVLWANWAEGGVQNINAEVKAWVNDTPPDYNLGNTAVVSGYYCDVQPFILDYPQVVVINITAGGESQEYHRIIRNSDNAVVWEHQWSADEDGSTDIQSDLLPAGSYSAVILLHDQDGPTSGYTRVRYIDQKYNKYAVNSSDWGKNWGVVLGPELVDSTNYGASAGTSPKYTHRVYMYTPAGTNSSNLYYERSISSTNQTITAKITNSGVVFGAPKLIVDDSDNCYVIWNDQRNGANQVFFQKIPENFAAINGSVTNALAIAKPSKVVLVSSATLESPSLIAPTKDRQDVQNIRPAFEWQHHKADTIEYRVEVAKNDSFTIDHQTFSKAAGTGTQDKADSTLYAFNYAIHEFDPGLERNTDYFWKVTALSPTNAATSEMWSFRIQPELTLVGVTNYPNPFNPNREQTKIRYRLSADADEVRIRIYDITGSLVTELDGTTNGEGMSVWQKYNDVSWDGRNGRGDLVVNGIYPFEITARIGDKTVSGRGKIAVLK